MILKRTLAAAATLTVAALLITACAPQAAPTPTGTSTPTPTSATREPVDPPADEAAAIAEAETTIDLILDEQEKVGNRGGTDTTVYETLATGKGLELFLADAKSLEEGPILNIDGDNVEGQSTAEGRINFTPTSAYGQENDGIENGLVIVPGCLDASERMITTADGKPAMQNPNPRNKVEFQVTYDKEQKLWLVSNRISTGETC